MAALYSEMGHSVVIKKTKVNHYMGFSQICRKAPTCTKCEGFTEGLLARPEVGKC